MNSNCKKIVNDNFIENFFFANSLGVISFEELILFNYSETFPIKLKEIRRIFVSEKRFFGWNLLFFLVSILLFVIVLTDCSSFTSKYYILFTVLSMLCLLFSVLFHKKNFKFIVLIENNFLEIKINNKDKIDAIVLVSKINEIILKN